MLEPSQGSLPYVGIPTPQPLTVGIDRNSLCFRNILPLPSRACPEFHAYIYSHTLVVSDSKTLRNGVEMDSILRGVNP